MVKRIIGSKISSSNLHSEPEASTIASNDTNADTCCLGKSFVIIEFTQRAADVYPYIKDIKPIVGVPIVSGVTAWDDLLDCNRFWLQPSPNEI